MQDSLKDVTKAILFDKPQNIITIQQNVKHRDEYSSNKFAILKDV